MAIIRYKDAAGNWKNLIAVEGGSGGGGDTVYIGYIPYDGDFTDGADVTDTITFKPTYHSLYGNYSRPMAFEARYVGSGDGDAYVFYNHSADFNYYLLCANIYFHAYTHNGEMKIIRLHYQYADETSAPQSITAHIVTDTYLGNIDTALDSIIAIQETLIGGGSV